MKKETKRSTVLFVRCDNHMTAHLFYELIQMIIWNHNCNEITMIILYCSFEHPRLRVYIYFEALVAQRVRWFVSFYNNDIYSFYVLLYEFFLFV